MSVVSSEFLWRFLHDVWDLLPAQDRKLFEAYWSAQLQIAGNLQQKVMEAALSTSVTDVPVFLTERWNRFVMDGTSCDVLAGSEPVVLVGTDPTTLTRFTVFYDTVSVSNAGLQITHSEHIEFFDESVRTLRYGGILLGTVRVSIGLLVFTEGRDYVVNRTEGTIQALTTGRIPIDQITTVTYDHATYTRGLDYEIAESYATLTRLDGSTIGDGDTVTVTYQYNNTPTLPLVGTGTGKVLDTLAAFEDLTKNFSALLPGRVLIITTGPNAGTYTISGVLSPTQVQVDGGFVAPGGGISYSINAFPHGQRVPANIVSITTLQERIDTPTFMLQEGVDYQVQDGILATRIAFPMMTTGPVQDRSRSLWAEKTRIDRETPYRNFGVLIDFYRKNSEAYKQALQGLWYTFWTGSTTGNLRRGLQILLGLPSARKAGTITSVTAPTDTADGEVQVTDSRGQILVYAIPKGLAIAETLALGSVVKRFDVLSTGIKIIDRISEPGFVAAHLGRPGIARFLTSNATTGPGDTDETKALTLLENHLFIPQVLARVITGQINVIELRRFLDNMKPEWTEYAFAFNEDIDESLTFTEGIESDVAIDLSTTFGSNEESRAWENSFEIDSLSGETFVGSQAAGNFRDLSVSFVAFGVGTDDKVVIGSGTFKGTHRVLARISDHVLSLDIADVDLVAENPLDYLVIPKEFELGHDTVTLLQEHIVRPGANYSAPASLNTKTDADLTGLKNEWVKALLLIDVTNVGSESQAITAANVVLNEVTVAVAPAVAATPHQLASASLVRTDNTGPTVTDAYAI